MGNTWGNSVRLYRIDAFELWCWRKLLRVPWTVRRSHQSILKISPGCSLEGLMVKLKPQYFGHLMRRVDSLEKTLMLGGIGGRRRRGRQRMRWLDGITDLWTWVWGDSRSWWWTGRPGMLRFMGQQVVGHDWATELNWTDRGSAVKNLPAMLEPLETGVRFLGQEDPLDEGMATHSSIIAWRIPQTEEPSRLQSMGSQGVRHNWATDNFPKTIFISTHGEY